MSLDAVLAGVPLAASLLSLPVTLVTVCWSWHAHRRAKAAPGTEVRTKAVTDLVDGLHHVRRLARQADVAAVTAGDVSAVMVDFEDRYHRHQAVLPRHLRAVDREVRAAMGNCFGAPAMAGWDARLGGRRLATFDHYWWDITRTYLDHVDTCLQEWRTAPTRRRPTRLVHFYTWRRDEDAECFEPARTPATALVRDQRAPCL